MRVEVFSERHHRWLIVRRIAVLGQASVNYDEYWTLNGTFSATEKPMVFKLRRDANDYLREHVLKINKAAHEN
jgi:hypothetical protein